MLRSGMENRRRLINVLQRIRRTCKCVSHRRDRNFLLIGLSVSKTRPNTQTRSSVKVCVVVKTNWQKAGKACGRCNAESYTSLGVRLLWRDSADALLFQFWSEKLPIQMLPTAAVKKIHDVDESTVHSGLFWIKWSLWITLLGRQLGALLILY